MTKRKFFLFAVSFLVFWVIFPIVRSFFNLEFATNDVKSAYSTFLIFAVPIAILCTLSGTLKIDESQFIHNGKIAATSITAIFVLMILIFAMAFDMCGTTDHELLYEHKNDANTRIIVRSFGCGAYDSDPTVKDVYKVNYFTPFLLHSVKIDTNEMDKSNWTKFITE
ncbi:MAG: hypothetical protein ACI8ZM_001241 [Crocinitomix sp.]|jgi:hypothetical protein